MIYLNNAATSWPKPACVAQAVCAAVAEPPGESSRGGLQRFDVFQAVRQALCPVLGVKEPEQIALGPNATWALNLALYGLDLKPGERVLATAAEHNSVLRPLNDLAARQRRRGRHCPSTLRKRWPLCPWR